MVFIGLGANLGQPFQTFLKAIISLKDAGVELIQGSSVYSTPPVGYLDQPTFCNAVIQVETSFSAFQLLCLLKEIERDLGRVETFKWGPRLIDLDILDFKQQVSQPQTAQDSILYLPHRYLSKRAFVLVPWAEITPEFKPGGYNKTIATLCHELPEAERAFIVRLGPLV